MANLRAIRRRIRSVKSTQQITKAMKMVAAAKLRRATEAMTAARPYAAGMARVLSSLASRVAGSAHPLLREPETESRVLLVVVTADKGLAGAFNAALLREAAAFLRDRPAGSVEIVVVGRKARDFFKRRTAPVVAEHTGLFQALRFADAASIAESLSKAFLEESGGKPPYDAVYVLSNEFRSVLSQKPAIRRLLPIERMPAAEGSGAVDYLYEPSAHALLAELLPRHLSTQIWRVLLESAAAEHAARMTAMESATKNAGEMISTLTLEMNRVRQASITKELIEVVSGAAAARR